MQTMDESWAVGSAGDARNPYATPHAAIALPSPVGTMSTYVPASRWSRLGARLLDQLMGFFACVPFVIGMIVGSEHIVLMVAFLATTALLLIGLVVANVIGLDRSGQTLGKRLVGIRILRSDGSHPTLGRSFGLRAVVPFVISFFFGPFGLIDVLWIFGNEHRCLHDLLADTIVVPAQ
ncbi:RDD family protein [Lysobacter sp. HA18]